MTRRQCKRAVVLVAAVLAAAALLFGCADYNTVGIAPAPVTLTVTNVTDSSVTLRWTQSTADDFKSYRVYYSATHDVVDTTDKLADSMSFAQDTMKTVTGLDHAKHYYFRVMVVSVDRLIGPSNIVDTTTLPDHNKITVQLLPPDSITDSSVVLHWQGIGDQNARYLIFRDTTQTVDTTDTIVARINDGTSATITGLARGKTYWFRVYFQSATGPAGGSNVQSATAGRPAPVRLSIVAGSATDTSLGIVWTRNADPNFSSYVVHFDTVVVDSTLPPDTGGRQTRTITLAADSALTLSPLRRDTGYWVRVFVKNAAGLASVSDTVSARTKSGPPLPVVLSIKKRDSTAVTLQWTRSHDRDTCHYLLYRDTLPQVDTTDTLRFTSIGMDDTIFADTGLRKATRYWYVVCVKGPSGFSAASNMRVNYQVVLRQDTTLGTATTALVWSKTTSHTFMSYQLFRSTSQVIDSTGAAIYVDTDQSITQYLDTPPDSGHVYYYQVYHYQLGPGGLAEGEPSNEIAVVGR